MCVPPPPRPVPHARRNYGWRVVTRNSRAALARVLWLRHSGTSEGISCCCCCCCSPLPHPPRVLPVSSLAPSIHHLTHTSYGPRHCQPSQRRPPPAPSAHHLHATRRRHSITAARLGSGVEKVVVCCRRHAGRARRSHHQDQLVNKCFVRRHSRSESGRRRCLRVVVARAAVALRRASQGRRRMHSCGRRRRAGLPRHHQAAVPPLPEAPLDWHLKDRSTAIKKINSFTMNVVSLRPRAPPCPAPRGAPAAPHAAPLHVSGTHQPRSRRGHRPHQ